MNNILIFGIVFSNFEYNFILLFMLNFFEKYFIYLF
jgi:hypothetical protein